MSTFTFRPWARQADNSQSLKDVLAQAGVERGPFRLITEASLRAEIEEGDSPISSSASEDTEQDDGESDGKPATVAELIQARTELLDHVQVAHNDALMALDFISWLSSRNIVGAEHSMSPALKDQVPVKTLGFDLWERMPVDKAREAQDNNIAENTRVEGLQNVADGLLAAAQRLQQNVREETSYWQQVLPVSEKGWNVCRLPGTRHQLGVTFGFSESLLAFSRKGFAAFVVGKDGNVTLAKGVGSKPKALRVSIVKNQETVATSRMPSKVDDETTLEDRIRHARDSLFDEELYHELMREGQTVYSLGVRVLSRRIILPADPDTKTEVKFELLPVDEAFDETTSIEDAAMAQGIATCARLLLSQAHRKRLYKRSQPAKPKSAEKAETLTLIIIQSLLALVKQINWFGQSSKEQIHMTE
ncbi:hypothetical protein K470DRAFT_217417 [Piedraia hortae CBS 480.64]|uniref:Mediator of RNA polymerase II transcription subunit 17 n=1 Tax=Piedraia hortae CBS 480.64 TaxID=1314780 RepID=A0A6A7BZ00_9PEZI|nr:hypothetical protein K470DRAFT_217417 [Piedraia hortae CBS 480.64]